MATSNFVARGDPGVRETMASFYQSPQERSRLEILYGGQILETSGQEQQIRAELRALRDLLAETDPQTQRIKAYFINQEIGKLEDRLARLSEGIGASSVAIAQPQAEDWKTQMGIYAHATDSGATGLTPIGSATGPLPVFKDVHVPTKNLSSMGTEPSQGFTASPYETPDYLQGWLTPIGARPLGAQTSAGPLQKQALWEQIALQQAGNVTSLEDYINRVEPYIALWGETHEAASKRLLPQSGRTAQWRPTRQ